MSGRRAVAAVLMVATMMAAGGAAADETVRLPKPRPPVEMTADEAWAEDLAARLREAEAGVPPVEAVPADMTGASPAHPLEAIGALARTPKPRPEPEPALMALVDPRGSVDAAPVPALEPVSDADHAACLLRLRALRVAFTEQAPIDPGGVCEVARPLVVTSVGGVALEPAATVNCATAEALAEWAAEVLAPTARRVLDAAPRAIVQASAYVCRPRNNVPGAKLSEHARANAIDIASIAFASRDALEIGDADADAGERRLELEIRTGACKHFTTVLGPGSDAAHATHLHFDLAERRGGYRLCDRGPAVASDAPKTKRE